PMEAHQKVVVQTGDITGLSSRLRLPSLAVAEGESLDIGVEEHVERDAGFAVDGVVVEDDESVEEGFACMSPARARQSSRCALACSYSMSPALICASRNASRRALRSCSLPRRSRGTAPA